MKNKSKGVIKISSSFINKNFINGSWIDGNQTQDVFNPATKELIGTIPLEGAKFASMAVEAASKAFKSWSNTTAHERSLIIQKWYQLIEENKEDLARIMTIEQGKPFNEALTEIEYANAYVMWYAEEGKRVYGDLIPASSQTKRIFVKKEPVGVVAAVTPWNFPAAMITRKLAPALAAGCTVVLKPASETPYTALMLIKLAEKAGFPKGVVNIVTGNSREIVKVWQMDPRVRKITFTGSTPVGKILMKDAADTMKKISLELGGHAPFIVTKYADIDKAVDGAIHSKFRNAGQACVATNRFYIAEEVLDEFTSKFVKRTAELVVGNGLEKGTDIGPLINENALLKVIEQIDDAVSKGAKILTGGKRIFEESGYFFQPTVISDVSDDMLCMIEETFGPLAPITTFKDNDEVIRRANNSPFGLAAYVFTENIDEALEIVDNLEYGVVGLNDGAPSTAEAPFGGYKESGTGREGGKYGIEDYLETKYISIGSKKY